MSQVKKDNSASCPVVAWVPFLLTQPSLLGINCHPDFYENPFFNFLIDFCLYLNLRYTASILLYRDVFAQSYSLRFKNIVAPGYRLFLFIAECIHIHLLTRHICGSILVVVDLWTVLLRQPYLYPGAHSTRKKGSALWFRA